MGSCDRHSTCTGTWRTGGGIRCLGRLGLAGRSQISGVALVSSFLPNTIFDTYLDKGVVFVGTVGVKQTKPFQRDLSSVGFCGRPELRSNPRCVLQNAKKRGSQRFLHF